MVTHDTPGVLGLDARDAKALDPAGGDVEETGERQARADAPRRRAAQQSADEQRAADAGVKAMSRR